MGGEIERIAGEAKLGQALRHAVVAIGNFDGVHRGHRAVLEKALGEAAKRRVPALALTFEPHPRTFFRPDESLFILTPAPFKASLLAQLGFDAVVEQPFTRDFAELSAEAFVTDILEERLGISHAVAGVDFHFGRNREGGPAFLMAAGQRHGFGVTLVDPFRDEGAEIVSSSRIRALLSEGAAAAAAALLGYRFTLEAEVIGGERLGRKLGYPTANMRLRGDVAIRHGIYAVRFRRADGILHDAVASFGRRPTVTENGAPILESFLFDFSGDLYGETCAVSFFGFLRGEEKFEDLDALITQMKRDEAEARALLSAVRPLSELDAAIAF